MCQFKLIQRVCITRLKQTRWFKLTHYTKVDRSWQQTSSRMCFMSHNWSAMKQRLHPQSVAEISRHSVLSGDRFNNVRHRLGLAERTQISVSKSPFPSASTPKCRRSVRKRFSRDHCCRGRSKPGCRIVRSHTRWELTTWADFQLCLHRLLMLIGCKSTSHNGDCNRLRTVILTPFQLCTGCCSLLYK